MTTPPPDVFRFPPGRICPRGPHRPVYRYTPAFRMLALHEQVHMTPSTPHPTRPEREKYSGAATARLFDVSRQCVTNWKAGGCPHTIDPMTGKAVYDPAAVHRWLLLVALGQRKRKRYDGPEARRQQSRTLARLVFLAREERQLALNASRALPLTPG
jgi:hypothetical protein